MTNELKVGDFVRIEDLVGRITSISAYIRVDFGDHSGLFLPRELKKIELIGPHYVRPNRITTWRYD